EEGDFGVKGEERGGRAADTGERVVRKRELAGVPGEEVPTYGENDVVGAGGEDVGVILGEQPRRPRERHERDDAPPDASDETRHRVRYRAARPEPARARGRRRPGAALHGGRGPSRADRGSRRPRRTS